MTPVLVNEHACAEAIGMSVFFLRKDRRTKRCVPFVRLGTSVRYNLERVREALAAQEEGGVARGRGRV